MSLADDVLEHARRDAPVLVGFLRARAARGVAVGQQAHGQLAKLRQQIVHRLRARRAEERRRLPLEEPVLGQSKENLEHRVDVARIAQVAHANETRPVDRRKLFPRLSDLIELELLVRVDVHLGDRGFCLLHAHHVDSPVCQVLGQLRVAHLSVLVVGVAVHVGAARRDGAQLDNQRKTIRREVHLRLVVVIERTIGSSRTVILPPPGANVPI
mmetsp:Transcript_27860/g.65032  ORF Transcript_27860/g.65032 Transcript_27860/m.65032 type:complete len:213 (-) Transcript_27860:634-1272(-)